MSQETCHDKITSLGGVSRWCASVPAGYCRLAGDACLRPAFAPNRLGFKPVSDNTSSTSLSSFRHGSPRPGVATLGVPRIGPRRELKTALEAYWAGRIDADALQQAAAGLRAASWARQRALGVTHIPSNDFSLYDHVLDTAVMVGAIPPGYGWDGGTAGLDTYFGLARGSRGETCAHGHAHDGADGQPALEMTKWFDTNYHYLVPEFAPDQSFVLSGTKPVDEFREALGLGIRTRPVLLGPVTFLRLGKIRGDGATPLSLLRALLPVYAEVLRRLQVSGAEWVQIDEPCLATDIDEETRQALRTTYSFFAYAQPKLKLMLTSYFGPLGDNLDLALSLPVAGLHLDLVRGAADFAAVQDRAPAGLVLSLGVIDGRNVWRADLAAIAERLKPFVARRGMDHILLAPSCSLLHVPLDLALETDLAPDVADWLSFAVQKIGELGVLAAALGGDGTAVATDLDAATQALARRRVSPRVHDSAVAARLAAITPQMLHRATPFAHRRRLQQEKLHLPLYPTTTIGSFPQTETVRKARADHVRGRMSTADYEIFLRRETESAVRWQEHIGLDVLVHGEFERNDMVQYFGEQLTGYAFTRHGWVQSYGSRCVRPPIIYGDVSRPQPMTVEWAVFAQSLTEKPMKGMLTGPVTMLQWSFVRDDCTRETVCRQIALALQDEVLDLERAGIGVIQIDEPALREGLPLRAAAWASYLRWAVEAFRLSYAGVADTTQIHTHMCYSDFNDIIAAIVALDADVISIETARSKMELLDAFAGEHYPNDIGPGVYDIHSPRVPTVDEMALLLERAGEHLAAGQIWVNPDCGLKTRRWEEVRPALVNMVAAARRLRTLHAAEAAQ